MKLHCDQCQYVVRPLDNFCSICGAEAPRRTLPTTIKNAEIEPAIFCPSCRERNIPDGLYCSACGGHLYKYSMNEQNINCPRCGERNSNNAKFCSNCTLSFADWAAMKGIVAESIGWKGSIALRDSQTEFSYTILTQKIVTLGRNESNSIVIPCQFVSSNHCDIGLAKKELADLNSANGTFINQSGERIQTEPLGYISEFNIAGYFTFKVLQIANLFVFRLSSILDENGCKQHGDMHAIEKLRRSYYILPFGDGEIFIRKYDGVIETEYKSEEKYYQVNILNHYCYFNDASKNIDNQLIMKQHNIFPQNWELVLL